MMEVRFLNRSHSGFLHVNSLVSSYLPTLYLRRITKMMTSKKRTNSIDNTTGSIVLIALWSSDGSVAPGESSSEKKIRRKINYCNF